MVGMGGCKAEGPVMVSPKRQRLMCPPKAQLRIRAVYLRDSAYASLPKLSASKRREKEASLRQDSLTKNTTATTSAVHLSNNRGQRMVRLP